MTMKEVLLFQALPSPENFEAGLRYEVGVGGTWTDTKPRQLAGSWPVQIQQNTYDVYWQVDGAELTLRLTDSASQLQTHSGRFAILKFLDGNLIPNPHLHVATGEHDSASGHLFVATSGRNVHRIELSFTMSGKDPCMRVKESMTRTHEVRMADAMPVQLHVTPEQVALVVDDVKSIYSVDWSAGRSSCVHSYSQGSYFPSMMNIVPGFKSQKPVSVISIDSFESNGQTYLAILWATAEVQVVHLKSYSKAQAVTTFRIGPDDTKTLATNGVVKILPSDAIHHDDEDMDEDDVETFACFAYANNVNPMAVQAFTLTMDTQVSCQLAASIPCPVGYSINTIKASVQSQGLAMALWKSDISSTSECLQPLMLGYTSEKGACSFNLDGNQGLSPVCGLSWSTRMGCYVVVRQTSVSVIIPSSLLDVVDTSLSLSQWGAVGGLMSPNGQVGISTRLSQMLQCWHHLVDQGQVDIRQGLNALLDMERRNYNQPLENTLAEWMRLLAGAPSTGTEHSEKILSQMRTIAARDGKEGTTGGELDLIIKIAASMIHIRHKMVGVFCQFLNRMSTMSYNGDDPELVALVRDLERWTVSKKVEVNQLNVYLKGMDAIASSSNGDALRKVFLRACGEQGTGEDPPDGHLSLEDYTSIATYFVSSIWIVRVDEDEYSLGLGIDDALVLKLANGFLDGWDYKGLEAFLDALQDHVLLLKHFRGFLYLNPKDHQPARAVEHWNAVQKEIDAWNPSKVEMDYCISILKELLNHVSPTHPPDIWKVKAITIQATMDPSWKDASVTMEVQNQYYHNVGVDATTLALEPNGEAKDVGLELRTASGEIVAQGWFRLDEALVPQTSNPTLALWNPLTAEPVTLPVPLSNGYGYLTLQLSAVYYGYQSSLVLGISKYPRGSMNRACIRHELYGNTSCLLALARTTSKEVILSPSSDVLFHQILQHYLAQKDWRAAYHHIAETISSSEAQRQRRMDAMCILIGKLVEQGPQGYQQINQFTYQDDLLLTTVSYLWTKAECADVRAFGNYSDPLFLEKGRKSVLPVSSVNYYHILYSFLFDRFDYQSACHVMHRLACRYQKESSFSQKDWEAALSCYVTCATTLALLPEEDQYFRLDANLPETLTTHKGTTKRSRSGDPIEEETEALSIQEIDITLPMIRRKLVRTKAELQLFMTNTNDTSTQPCQGGSKDLKSLLQIQRPEDIVQLLVDNRLYNDAVNVCDAYDIPESLDCVFQSLAQWCLHLHRQTAVLQEHVYPMGGVKHETVCRQAWELLRQLLADAETKHPLHRQNPKYREYRYYETVLATLLTLRGVPTSGGEPFAGHIQPPTWIIQKVMYHNPSKLIHIYLMHDLLDQAAEVAVSYLDWKFGNGGQDNDFPCSQPFAGNVSVSNNMLDRLYCRLQQNSPQDFMTRYPNLLLGQIQEEASVLRAGGC